MARRSDPRAVGRDPDPRFTLANERTYLAWNRTALALIGGGLAAGQLLDFHSRTARLIVALPPIALGLILALAVDVNLSGIDLQLVGWILAVVGVVGLLITLTALNRRRTTVREEAVLREPPMVRREERVIREDPPPPPY